MAVEAIGGVSVSSQTAAQQNLNVTQADFLKLLVTQLSFQDPLKPVDNQQFLAQMTFPGTRHYIETVAKRRAKYRDEFQPPSPGPAK